METDHHRDGSKAHTGTADDKDSFLREPAYTLSIEQLLEAVGGDSTS